MTSATDVSNLRLMKSNAKKGAFRKLIKFGNVMGGTSATRTRFAQSARGHG